jgi:hypothetical protein
MNIPHMNTRPPRSFTSTRSEHLQNSSESGPKNGSKTKPAEGVRKEKQAPNSSNSSQAPDLSAKCLLNNLRAAKRILGPHLESRMASQLRALSRDYGFAIDAGEIQILEGNWYVTHTGLVRLARRKRCRGIHVEAVNSLCDSASNHYVLKATVYPSKGSVGFVGYGDADPSNVSQRVRGAEMRMAETRAVNRALRKAYGVGICSVEEIGSFAGPVGSASSSPKIAPNGTNGNGNGSGHKVRDRLCQIIRRHKLDPELVKAYAVDFCGTKALKDATRGQVESFVQQLADSAQKDRDALLCQLNSYARPNQEVVA